MKKIKEFSKKYLIGCFIGLILFTGVGVSAAAVFPSNQTTYDNKVSGLKSTNVQGAIDELYNTCFPPKTTGDTILDNVDIVTSGDGLYKDEYEDGKYTYKGANPNNYITFNDEKAGWRIVSINSDGTIKIMRSVSIGKIAWDTSNSNNWNRPASLNTYLNSTYYNSLTSTAQSQIVTATYYAGAVTNDNNDMQDQINDEKSIISNVKVALPTVSEYIRNNSNKSNCGTFSLNNDNARSTCPNSNWMFNRSDIWLTLSPDSSISFAVFRAGDIGGCGVYSNGGSVNSAQYGVRPVVTLSSDIQITGGDGSSSNPYQLSL